MVTMKTRNTYFGLFVGVMSTGAGFADAACNLTPPLVIMEEGQTANFEAVCQEALETINWQITDADNVAYDTGPLSISSYPNEVIRYTPPSIVLNNSGEYTINIAGALADTSVVSAPVDALVIVLENPNVTSDPVVTDPVVTDPVVTDPVVTDPVVTDPSCTTPNNVKVVNTLIPDTSYSQTAFTSVAPETVYAFKFSTDSSSSVTWGTAKYVNTTSGEGGKTVRITTCPGDTAPVSLRCSRSGTEAASVEYYTNINNTGYCELQADATYYVQVINKLDPSSTTYSCGSSLNPEVETSACGFYFSAN